MKHLCSVAGAVAAFPLLCYFALLGGALYTWSVVGHWPGYNHPDPHHLPIYYPAVIAALVGLIAVVASPLCLLVLRFLRARFRQSWHMHLPSLAVWYATGAVIWVIDFLCWRSGSGGLTHWIFD